MSAVAGIRKARLGGIGRRPQIDTKRPRFTVVHIAGAGWIVLDPEGVKRSAPVEQKHVAQAHRDLLQAEADRRAKRGARPCMCCGEVFESQGIHNRLCWICGRRDDPMGSAHRARVPQRRDNA